MKVGNTGRLVILSGPSCVGKSPLAKAVARLYPDLAGALTPVVLYNSRSPRPAEKNGQDYHFRSRVKVEELKGDRDFIVREVRGDLQALNIPELTDQLSTGDVLYEGNPLFAVELIRSRKLVQIPRLTIFMAPLSRAEIIQLRDSDAGGNLGSQIKALMEDKLNQRARKLWGKLTPRRKSAIATRAESAYGELQTAHRFDFIIVNHDREGSSNWDSFDRPVGDAGNALRVFASLLRGEIPPEVEKWEPGLLP